MVLAWEAMWALIPDLFIGASSVSCRLVSKLTLIGRHNGLCIHIPCRRSAWRNSCWGVCTLSHNQHGHARTREVSQSMAHQHRYHLILTYSQPGKADVRSLHYTFGTYLTLLGFSATTEYSCTTTRYLCVKLPSSWSTRRGQRTMWTAFFNIQTRCSNSFIY